MCNMQQWKKHVVNGMGQCMEDSVNGCVEVQQRKHQVCAANGNHACGSEWKTCFER